MQTLRTNIGKPNDPRRIKLELQSKYFYGQKLSTLSLVKDEKVLPVLNAIGKVGAVMDHARRVFYIGNA